MLTICSYFVQWELMYMRHVANSRENHKASQDTCERVGDAHNQRISVREGGGD